MFSSTPCCPDALLAAPCGACATSSFCKNERHQSLTVCIQPFVTLCLPVAGNPSTSLPPPRSSSGFKSLRPGQREAIQSLLEGRDTLLVQPTGSGKSAVYQIAGSLLAGSTIDHFSAHRSSKGSGRLDPGERSRRNGGPQLHSLHLRASRNSGAVSKRAKLNSSSLRLSSFAIQKPSNVSGVPAYRSSPSMRRTASATGATIFVPITSNWLT